MILRPYRAGLERELGEHASLVALLRDRRAETYLARAAVLRSLCSEQRTSPSRPAAAALLLAFEPMLTRIACASAVSDCAAVVVACFLDAVASLPAAVVHVAPALRWATLRRVRHVVRAHERAPVITEKLPEQAEDPSDWLLARAILMRRVPRVRSRVRTAAALKRSRSRALARLRADLVAA